MDWVELGWVTLHSVTSHYSRVVLDDVFVKLFDFLHYRRLVDRIPAPVRLAKLVENVTGVGKAQGLQVAPFIDVQRFIALERELSKKRPVRMQRR